LLKRLKIFSVVLIAVSLLSGLTAFAAPGGSFFSEPPEQAWEPDKDVIAGYKIIPKVDIAVTALGRDALGMAQNHEVTLWDMTNRMEASPTWGEEEPARVDFESAVLLATVEVTPDSSQDSGFFYVELAEPIVLKAGNLYAIAAQEYEDGDYVPHVHGCDLSNIPSLVNENIAYICEDAHNGIANGAELPAGMDVAPPINWWFHDWFQDGENPAYRAGGAFGSSCQGILSSVNFWYDEELTVPLTDDEVNALYPPAISEEAAEETAEAEETVEEEAIIEETISEETTIEETVEEKVEETAFEEIMPVKETDRNEAIPPTNDNSIGASGYVLILMLAALGMIILIAKKGTKIF